MNTFASKHAESVSGEIPLALEARMVIVVGKGVWALASG